MAATALPVTSVDFELAASGEGVHHIVFSAPAAQESEARRLALASWGTFEFEASRYSAARWITLTTAGDAEDFEVSVQGGQTLYKAADYGPGHIIVKGPLTCTFTPNPPAMQGSMFTPSRVDCVAPRGRLGRW